MIARCHSSFSGVIGVAREDITPPPGIYCRNWGAAKGDTARGIHRPLTLTALTLQTGVGARPLVFVDADLGWFRNPIFARDFIDGIRETFGLAREEFLFGMTHTHSAPPLVDEIENDWSGSELLEPFTEKVRRATVAAVRSALESASPALLEWHTGTCQLASQRDLPEGDRFVVGYNPGGAADDTLLVGRVTRTDGSILATITNYACHPTTLAWDNDLVSPDYIGAMRETIESQTAQAPALFMQGASGDLAPRHQYVGDVGVADRHGRQLGYAVLATLADMNPPGKNLEFAGIIESGASLGIWEHTTSRPSRELNVKMQTLLLPLKDWPKAEELEEQLRECKDRTMAERIRRKLRIRRGIGDTSTFPLDLHICQIGDAFLCGTMLESYFDMQKELRAAFPDSRILWLNVLNGFLGYLPPSDRYGSDLYSVWQTPINQGAFEQVLAASKEAIGSILCRDARKPGAP